MLSLGSVGDPSHNGGHALDTAETRQRIAAQLVGRERELELLLSTVAAGRNIVLEGPPGTSKTTMLRAITAEWGIALMLVEGNAELTPSKLLGHHNPARVLQEDYSPNNFVPGPLVEAMQQGGFLYIEELNRAPEDTLNTLLMAIADRQITIPRVGMIRAEPTFRIVASMNPYDNVGTSRLSTSVLDRLCRLAVDYQDEAAERGIAWLRSGVDSEHALSEQVVNNAVAATRATRAHRDVRQGSSVRGAIDTVLVGIELAKIRGIEAPDDPRYPEALLDALILALSGRIQLDEVAETTPERVLHEIWTELMQRESEAAAPG